MPAPDAPLPSQQPRKIPRESENVLKLAEDLGLEREAWASRPTAIEFGFNNQCNLPEAVEANRRAKAG